MGSGIYNSAIPSMDQCALPAAAVRVVFVFLCLITSVARGVAADWSGPGEQLARKIVAVTGPRAVALTFENRSSLPQRTSEEIHQRIRADLQALGVRLVAPEQATATVAVSLSQNTHSYVWVAEVQGGTEPAVAMVAIPRGEGPSFIGERESLTVRKTPLWAQRERILDVAVLEEALNPTHIAVLDDEKVALYRNENGKWRPELAAMLPLDHPWPRDLRGRLIPSKDHFLDVYLPGVVCRGNGRGTFSLSCRESDDPWPLVAPTFAGVGTVFPSFGAASNATPGVPAMGAFFAPTRNFFTGALAPGVGSLKTVPKFYAAAFLPREKYGLWFFTSVDGQVHMLDGVTDISARLEWGSDLASVRSSCGGGWQLLVTSAAGQSGDSVQAYEVPDRDPVAVGAALPLPGEVTALWTEAKGDSAVAVVRDRETGTYEASRLAVACNQ
jgi:hypothetical protein